MTRCLPAAVLVLAAPLAGTEPPPATAAEPPAANAPAPPASPTGVRRLSELGAHALAFDEQGALYFGRERTAAPTGKVTTVVEEDYPGPCGATDLDFDDQGNMYVAYADKLARYTPAGEKTIVLDGAGLTPALRWLVGVRIDRRRGEVYLSDVRTKRVLVARFAPDGRLAINRVLELPEHPEYFAVSDDGQVHVGFPEADAVARIDDHPRHSLRRLGEPADFVATLSFGGRGFDRTALYAACSSGIFEIPRAED